MTTAYKNVELPTNRHNEPISGLFFSLQPLFITLTTSGQ